MKSSEGKKSSKLSAFDYLCLIEQAEKLRGGGQDVLVNAKEGWLGLMFLSGQSVLMSPLEEIAAIIPTTTFVPVPKVKPWIVGMSSYRGEAFVVTDLAGMLTSQLSLITKSSRILIIATQGEYSGILVNRVLGLQRVTKKYNVDAIPEGLMAEYWPFVTGAMMTEQFQLPIISCQAIVRHPQFKNVIAQYDRGNE